MQWIDAKVKLPLLDSDREYARETFLVTIPQGNKLKTISMERVKKKIRGKIVERWEWNGRISPWEPIHWMPLPEPPFNFELK